MDLRHLAATERWSATTVLFTVASLIAVSGLVAILEGPIGVPNASSAYLLAVLVCAMAFGTGAGILAAFGGFLLYDFLFVEPIHTFVVERPRRVAQPRPPPRRRDRRRPARGHPASARRGGRRARARGDRPVPGQPRPGDPVRDDRRPRRDRRVAPDRGRLRPGLDRADPTAGPENGSSPTPAARRPIPTPTASHAVLRRMPGDTPAQWVKVHQPGVRRAGGLRAPRPPGGHRGRRADDRIRLGSPGTQRRRTGSGRDAAARRRGRPDRPGPRAGPAGRGGQGGRDRPPERRPEVGPARVGLARPAHTAGHDPGGGRDDARPTAR